MTYAEQLPDLIAAYKAEMKKCEEARRALWHGFAERIRTIDDIGKPRRKGERHDR